MLFEITYETNGRSGTMLGFADCDADALAQFIAAWEAHGDEWTGSAWISGRWA